MEGSVNQQAGSRICSEAITPSMSPSPTTQITSRVQLLCLGLLPESPSGTQSLSILAAGVLQSVFPPDPDMLSHRTL